MLQEGKLKSKMNDLSKESRRSCYWNSNSRLRSRGLSGVFLKDQEIEAIKKRHKEDKNSVIKEKSMVEV